MMVMHRASLVFALALLGCSQALRPVARTTVARQPHLSMSRRQLATAATAAAVSSLPMPGGWRASAASNLKKKKALTPELVQILRVKESTYQETRLISSGKYKDLQRLNIKRAIGMMLENSELRERFIAASFYCEPEQIAAATQYGNTAVESLIQILEYFPDKLKVNDITPDQKKFVLAALNSVSRNIDSFLTLMPADQVKAARDQIEEENRLNLAELPDDVTLLNPPKVDGA